MGSIWGSLTSLFDFLAKGGLKSNVMVAGTRWSGYHSYVLMPITSTTKTYCWYHYLECWPDRVLQR